MDRESFSTLVDRLEGLEWFIFSGLAVKIYSGADREFGDLDLALRDEYIDEFAERLGTEVEDRDFVKKGNHVDDRGFETVFRGIEVEATSGFPVERMEDGTFDKLFDRAEKRQFMGREVNLVPLEELIVHKAKMDRQKDRTDLSRLNGLEIDRDFVLELVEDWGLEIERIRSFLKEEGITLEEI